MKTTALAYVYMGLRYPLRPDGEPNYSAQKVWMPEVWRCEVGDDDSRVFISAQTVTVEVPDDFNGTAKQIAAIERRKLEALNEYQRTVAECNERLSKLQALEAA